LAKEVQSEATDALGDQEYWLSYQIGFPSQKALITVFRGNLLNSPDPSLLSKLFFRDMMGIVRSIAKVRQMEEIEETVGVIKKEAGAIPSPKLKDSIMKSVAKLERHIKQIEEIDKKQTKLEDEMTGVRKLIGSKTFGEWKVLLSEIDKINLRIDSLSEIKKTYDTLFAQQTEFMKQQSKVMEQQASFVIWIKYATILVPIAVMLAPVIDVLIRHFISIHEISFYTFQLALFRKSKMNLRLSLSSTIIPS